MSLKSKRVAQQQIKMYAKASVTKHEKFLPNPSTFTFTPDPYTFVADDGTPLYEFAMQRFLIQETGNTTQYTLNWVATSKGWSATSKFGDGPPDIFIEIQNANQADLDSWDVGKPDLLCLTGVPMVFTNPKGMPNILENNATLSVILSFRPPADFFICS